MHAILVPHSSSFPSPASPALSPAVLKRSPSALKQSSEKLHSKLRALKQALCCSDEELLVMLGTTRNLLGLRADTVKEKLRSLGKVLGLPAEEVSSLVRKCPHLLCCSAETIASKFKGLKLLVSRQEVEQEGGGTETPSPLSLPPSLAACMHMHGALMHPWGTCAAG